MSPFDKMRENIEIYPVTLTFIIFQTAGVSFENIPSTYRTPDNIRWGNEDNSKIIFLISQQKHMFSFLNENIYCDSSLELSQWDSSNDGSQNMF